jgi:hypothetical protein
MEASRIEVRGQGWSRASEEARRRRLVCPSKAFL